MKTKVLFIDALILFSLLIGCDKQESEDILDIPDEEVPVNTQLPNGYFEVNFLTSTFDSQTKIAIVGSDTRIQHIHYVIYKSTGEYVKEKTILIPSQGTPTWPLPVIRDTLPKGSYKAVFLGNIEKTLFPYATASSPVNYEDILTNYKVSYNDARIILPPSEFTGNTEYYWDNATFSDTAPNPTILLERIIGLLRLHRNFVDTNNAINKLTQNILREIDYENIIREALLGVAADHSDGILYEVLRPILENRLTGLLTVVIDPLLNQLILDLVGPVTDALYDQILDQLIAQIELALEANATGGEGGLAYLGRILNPWAYGAEAIVTIDNFPKSIDFDLNVLDYFIGEQKFKYNLKTDTGGTVNDRYVAIKGFNGDYNIKQIDILAQGLVSGLVVDQIIGNDLLLPGAFMDITDPLSATDPKTNWRYRSDYSFLDLYLKSYIQQEDGSHSLTLSVVLGNIGNIDNILNGSINIVKALPILGSIISLLSNDIVNLILGDIKALTVSVPINLPLLGIENLEISGGWTTVSKY